jgi:hypothetical protein
MVSSLVAQGVSLLDVDQHERTFACKNRSENVHHKGSKSRKSSSSNAIGPEGAFAALSVIHRTIGDILQIGA